MSLESLAVALKPLKRRIDKAATWPLIDQFVLYFLTPPAHRNASAELRNTAASLFFGVPLSGVVLAALTQHPLFFLAPLALVVTVFFLRWREVTARFDVYIRLPAVGESFFSAVSAIHKSATRVSNYDKHYVEETLVDYLKGFRVITASEFYGVFLELQRACGGPEVIAQSAHYEMAELIEQAQANRQRLPLLSGVVEDPALREHAHSYSALLDDSIEDVSPVDGQGLLDAKRQLGELLSGVGRTTDDVSVRSDLSGSKQDQIEEPLDGENSLSTKEEETEGVVAERGPETFSADEASVDDTDEAFFDGEDNPFPDDEDADDEDADVEDVSEDSTNSGEGDGFDDFDQFVASDDSDK
jgi:hypothetical protein